MASVFPAHSLQRPRDSESRTGLYTIWETLPTTDIVGGCASIVSSAHNIGAKYRPVSRLSKRVCGSIPTSISKGALNVVNGVGSLGSLGTGAKLLAKAGQEAVQSGQDADVERGSYSAMTAISGASLFIGGALSTIQVWAKFMKNAALVKAVSPLLPYVFLPSSISVLIEGLMLLRHTTSFRQDYGVTRAEDSATLLLRMRYLHSFFTVSEEESQELEQAVNNAELDKFQKQMEKVLQGSSGITDYDVCSHARCNTQEAAVLKDQLLRRKKEALQRRIGALCMQEIENVDLEALIGNLQNEGDIRALAKAKKLDALIRKESYKKMVLATFLILAALIGIASFIIGLLISGGMLPMLIGLALGLLWLLIDSDMINSAAEKVWSLYEGQQPDAIENG